MYSSLLAANREERTSFSHQAQVQPRVSHADADFHASGIRACDTWGQQTVSRGGSVSTGPPYLVLTMAMVAQNGEMSRQQLKPSSPVVLDENVAAVSEI